MKFLKKLLPGLILFYGLICTGAWYFQESLLFLPEKLPQNYQFDFPIAFEEKWIRTGTIRLHGILFKADSAKGLLFYLHGNGGSLRSWGTVAPLYTGLGYDVFMPDYRGYGKSGGQITGQQQFLKDIKILWDSLAPPYRNRTTIILGYSIGTGPAT